MAIFTRSLNYTTSLRSDFLVDAIQREFGWVEEIHFLQDPSALGYIMKIKASDDFNYRWVVEDF